MGGNVLVPDVFVFFLIKSEGRRVAQDLGPFNNNSNETETCPWAHVLSKPSCPPHLLPQRKHRRLWLGQWRPSWTAPGPAKALHGDSLSSHGVIWRED